MQFFPGCQVHVITKKEDFPRFRRACGPKLQLWDEEELIPGMTLESLRKVALPFFPRGAGWYFQQFLKLAFVDVSNNDRHYLIWDADTVLLRSLELFDEQGRPFYTKAEEHHRPYFSTFEALFGVSAEREFSFISQHQVIDKNVLREMFAEIQARHPASRSWAWAIMDNLKGEGTNLFSEYETYGHFLKLRYPGTFSVRSLEWNRRGGGRFGLRPSRLRLRRLARNYDFAAFEAGDNVWRRCAKNLRERLLA